MYTIHDVLVVMAVLMWQQVEYWYTTEHHWWHVICVPVHEVACKGTGEEENKPMPGQQKDYWYEGCGQ